MKKTNSSNDLSSHDEQMPDLSGSDPVLSGYYQYLGGCTPLSAAEEAILWNKIEKILQKIRENLYPFGFVMREHIKLLDSLDTDELNDTFHFPEYDDTAVTAAGWKKEIISLCAEKEEKFHSNQKYGECDEQEIVELLGRFPVHAAKLREWFHLVGICLSDSDPESKLLLSPDKARASLNLLEQDFAAMDLICQTIINANLRLVVNLAKQYHRDGLQMQDMIQEGNLGLMRALDRFDHTRGHRFATYATWWIKQGVLRSIATQTRIIRLPAHMLRTIAQIRRAESQFIQKNGKDPEVSDLVSMVNMSAERIRAVQKMAAQPISLLAPVGDEESNLTLEQVLPQDENTLSPEKNISSALVKGRLKKALDTLNERERQILIMHFGLNDMQPKNILELSQMFHVTKTRIRQIEAAALQKLRSPEISGTIDEYYD